MGKVLVVRKPDRTVHVVPLGNKSILMGMNHRLPAAHKMKFEEMEEAEALKLPFFDKNYVSASEAQDKLKEVEGELHEKDSQIAELEAKLAALLAQQNVNPTNTAQTASQLIELIGKVETVEEAKAFLEGEKRATVIAAANKRIAELEAK